MAISRDYSKNKIALVLGVNGQDGSYIAELLKKNGWEVTGVARQKTRSPFLCKIGINFVSMDIANTSQLNELILRCKPDLIIHVAAVHGAFGFDYRAVWENLHLVNTLSLHSLLESSVRLSDMIGESPNIFYFGSAKSFGDLEGRIINETSERYGNCLYSITKNTSFDLIRYYREHYKLSISNVWLFNHDSERRSSKQYFVPKVVDALHRALLDSSETTLFETLDFWCDIGHAREFMELIVDSIEQIAGNDVIIATGKTANARDIVDSVFANYGLSSSRHVKVKKTFDLDENTRWHVDISRLKSISGKSPQIYAKEVIMQVFNSSYGLTQKIEYKRN